MCRASPGTLSLSGAGAGRGSWEKWDALGHQVSASMLEPMWMPVCPLSSSAGLMGGCPLLSCLGASAHPLLGAGLPSVVSAIWVGGQQSRPGWPESALCWAGEALCFAAALSLMKLLYHSGLSVQRCWRWGLCNTHSVKGPSGKLSDHAGVARGRTGPAGCAEGWACVRHHALGGEQSVLAEVHTQGCLMEAVRSSPGEARGRGAQ